MWVHACVQRRPVRRCRATELKLERRCRLALTPVFASAASTCPRRRTSHATHVLGGRRLGRRVVAVPAYVRARAANRKPARRSRRLIARARRGERACRPGRAAITCPAVDSQPPSLQWRPPAPTALRAPAFRATSDLTSAKAPIGGWLFSGACTRTDVERVAAGGAPPTSFTRRLNGRGGGDTVRANLPWARPVGLSCASTSDLTVSWATTAAGVSVSGVRSAGGHRRQPAARAPPWCLAPSDWHSLRPYVQHVRTRLIMRSFWERPARRDSQLRSCGAPPTRRGRPAGGTCSPLNDGTASWGAANSNTPSVAGTCAPGYTATGGVALMCSCGADFRPGAPPRTRARVRSLASLGCGTAACTTALIHAVTVCDPVRCVTHTTDGAPCMHTEMVCSTITHPAAHATFNATVAGAPATGTCLPGYGVTASSTPSRSCTLTGVWSTVVELHWYARIAGGELIPYAWGWRRALKTVGTGLLGMRAALYCVWQHRVQRGLAVGHCPAGTMSRACTVQLAGLAPSAASASTAGSGRARRSAGARVRVCAHRTCTRPRALTVTVAGVGHTRTSSCVCVCVCVCVGGDRPSRRCSATPRTLAVWTATHRG